MNLGMKGGDVPMRPGTADLGRTETVQGVRARLPSLSALIAMNLPGTTSTGLTPSTTIGPRRVAWD